jgi:hypothetical protein
MQLTEQEKMDVNTETFIELYLDPPNNIFKNEYLFVYWKDMNKRANILGVGLNCQILKKHIKSMPYHIYLKTVYWKTISSMVKLEMGSFCKLCGNENNLAVHHCDYNYLGQELWNLETLTCLCFKCHALFHGKL